MKKSTSILIIFILTVGIFTTLLFNNTKAANSYSSTALNIANFLVDNQDENGMIADVPNDAEYSLVNEDSNMEYALIGIAAAYQESGDIKYLNALKKGVEWLAAREDMTASMWNGSFRYAYESSYPYAPVAVSPGRGITDARGVDATSALFVYALELYTRLSGSTALAKEYETHARSALNFILDYNQAPNGFFYSSWQQKNGQWVLWKFQYTADQADVYLGMQSGWLLYGDTRYKSAADNIANNIESYFFIPSQGKYALGLDEYGTPDPDQEWFNGTFPQGYVPWVFGDSINNQSAWNWIKNCQQADGSLSCFSNDPLYSLSASIYALPSANLSKPLPTTALDWIINTTYDPIDHGIKDTANDGKEKYSNVAGFTIASMLQFSAFGNSLPPPVVIDGQCGVSATNYSHDTTSYGSNPDFCSAGIPPILPTNFPFQGSFVSWVCTGQNGGKDQSCTATRELVPTCGSAMRTYNYDEIFPGNYTYCASGNPDPTTPLDPNQGGYTNWVCRGINGGAPSNQCSSNRSLAPKPTDITIISSVSLGRDDAEESILGAVNLSNSNLKIVYNSSKGNQIIGLRFISLDIPKGAIITNAYLEFTVGKVSTGPANFTIVAENTNNSKFFPTINYSISSRNRTSANVIWSPENWDTVGAKIQSPNLSSLIQEVVNRSGWNFDNAMSFIITGSGTRTAVARNQSSTMATKLIVTYK